HDCLPIVEIQRHGHGHKLMPSCVRSSSKLRCCEPRFGKKVKRSGPVPYFWRDWTHGGTVLKSCGTPPRAIRIAGISMPKTKRSTPATAFIGAGSSLLTSANKHQMIAGK